MNTVAPPLCLPLPPLRTFARNVHTHVCREMFQEILDAFERDAQHAGYRFVKGAAEVPINSNATARLEVAVLTAVNLYKAPWRPSPNIEAEVKRSVRRGCGRGWVCDILRALASVGVVPVHATETSGSGQDRPLSPACSESLREYAYAVYNYMNVAVLTNALDVFEATALERGYTFATDSRAPPQLDETTLSELGEALLVAEDAYFCPDDPQQWVRGGDSARRAVAQGMASSLLDGIRSTLAAKGVVPVAACARRDDGATAQVNARSQTPATSLRGHALAVHQRVAERKFAVLLDAFERAAHSAGYVFASDHRAVEMDAYALGQTASAVLLANEIHKRPKRDLAACERMAWERLAEGEGYVWVRAIVHALAAERIFLAKADSCVLPQEGSIVATTPANEQSARWAIDGAIATIGRHLTALVQAAGTAATHRHRASSGLYSEEGRGELQASRPVVEGETLVSYRGVDSRLWFRPASEFDDGRFETVPSERDQEHPATLSEEDMTARMRSAGFGDADISDKALRDRIARLLLLDRG